MNVYFLMIIILSLINIKFYFKNFNNNYLSKDNTSSIKGIFVLIVFYSHLVTYITVNNSKDFIMLYLRNFLGQLMVTMFLFYSGYGVYESIKKRQKEYINQIPQRRILKTYINFWIAIFSFIILNLAFKIKYSVKNILLSFIGWTSIGNSNWYIFSIIVMYLITYISFKIFNKSNKKTLALNILLSILFILSMSIIKEDYWFNTILTYPFGLLYSYNKEKVENILFKNQNYFIILLLTSISFIFFKKISSFSYWYYEICSIFFVFLIVLITLKININNRILRWIGSNVFWIYILQRLPMIALKEIGFNKFTYKYSLICFIITMILSFIYSSLFDKILPKTNNNKKHEIYCK